MPKGLIRREWAGEERAFRLTAGGWETIKDDCGLEPGEVLKALAPVTLLRDMIAAGAARAGGLTEADQAQARGMAIAQAFAGGYGGSASPRLVKTLILEALLGGEETGRKDASILVKRWIDPYPNDIDDQLLAFEIAAAGWLGPKDDPVGEAAAAGGADPVA